MVFNMTQTNYSRGTNLLKKAYSLIEKTVLYMNRKTELCSIGSYDRL